MVSIADVLVSLAVKSSFLLCLGLVAAFTPRLSAATRHLILFVALAATIALPVISLGAPSLAVPILQPAVHASPTAAAINSAAAASLSWSGVLVMVLLVVWTVGAALMGALTVRSWLAVRGVSHRAQPLEDADWLALLDECCEQLALPRPRLASSRETDVAFAYGWTKPAIIIPADAPEWPQARRRDVLLHELSHIERRDVLTQFVAQVARAVYFWNPLATLVERRLCEEREYACDDRVLACGREPDTYAATLVDVAECLSGEHTAVAAVVPAMAGASQLEKRVLAILDVNRRRDRMTLGKVVLVGISSIAVLLPLAALRAAEGQPGAAMPRKEMPATDGKERPATDGDWAMSGSVSVSGAMSGHNAVAPAGGPADSAGPNESPPAASEISNVFVLRNSAARVMADSAAPNAESSSEIIAPAPVPGAVGIGVVYSMPDGQRAVDVSVDAAGQLHRRDQVNGQVREWSTESARVLLEAIARSKLAEAEKAALAERIEAELQRDTEEPAAPD